MCPQCASPYIACTFAPLPPYSLVSSFVSHFRGSGFGVEREEREVLAAQLWACTFAVRCLDRYTIWTAMFVATHNGPQFVCGQAPPVDGPMGQRGTYAIQRGRECASSHRLGYPEGAGCQLLVRGGASNPPTHPMRSNVPIPRGGANEPRACHSPPDIRGHAPDVTPDAPQLGEREATATPSATIPPRIFGPDWTVRDPALSSRCTWSHRYPLSCHQPPCESAVVPCICRLSGVNIRVSKCLSFSDYTSCPCNLTFPTNIISSGGLEN
uniref:uncharacterized protein n=1 Tax=Myxine glutinosa TaxID=7769 RepID=UPI00358F487D